MPNSTPRSPLTSIASTTKNAFIRAWDIIHRSSSNAWHVPSKVSTKSDEDQPPYHTPVFVLTHHPRAPLRMAGGTEFRFVTEGIHAALEQARAAAGGRDVRVGGGVSTIRQYLRAALIDELHLAIRPVLLGSGEHLLNDIDMRALGYECAKYVAGERAAHVFLRKRA